MSIEKSNDILLIEIIERIKSMFGFKSDAEVANAIGILPGNLSERKTRNSIPFEKLFYFSKEKDVFFDWLLTGEGKTQVGAEKQNNVAREAPVLYGNDFTLVPKYDVEASAGGGRLIHSEQIVDHLAFKTSWLRAALGLDPKHLVLITSIGDSMEPTLRAGDLLLLDRGVDSIQDDALYAIMIDDSLYVKRVQRMFDGAVIVKSDNPAYREQTVNKEQAEGLQVVGRLVWVGRRV